MLLSSKLVPNILVKSARYYFTTVKRFMVENSGPPLKKLLIMNKTIGTHNGTFHCDEVLACSMLKLLPEYKDAEIVRTRDLNVLKDCDVVLDVGGIYDPKIHRYDHHQRTFEESMNSLKPEKPWVTKLSSAGLIYCHFGHNIIKEVLGIKTEDPIVEVVYDKIYKNFMEEIDAIDNGISTNDGKPRYIITTDLSRRVAHLNPNWKEPADDKSMRVRFNKAMELVLAEFLYRINYYSAVWWPVRALIKEAVEKRFSVDPSGEIMELENGGLPWKLHFFELESEMELVTPTKYVIFPDTNGSYRVQCVPLHETSFENRLSLPEPWQGVRDEDLSKLIGIPGAVFVHANGFIGGHSNREGALEMARKALNFNKM